MSKHCKNNPIVNIQKNVQNFLLCLNISGKIKYHVGACNLE